MAAIARLARRAALALLALLAPLASTAAPLAVEQVAPGVWVHYGRQQDFVPASGGDIANLGFVVGERCVAVIDTGGSLAVGAALREAVAHVTPLPVCWVIDTHMHQDHVLGNAAFAGGERPPVFVASAKFTAALSAREHFYLHALERDFGTPMTHEQVVYPTQTVAATQELDLGGRRLLLRAWPTAHTDNDLTVYDERSRTLFTGDLLFVERLPVLDGNLRGWIKALDALAALPADVVVPGHGPLRRGAATAFDDERAYLVALRDGTRAAIRNKMTIQQAVDTVAAGAAKGWLLADQYHRRNVTAAYAELEWED